MKEEQIKKIMYLDYKPEQNKVKLQKILHNIPQFKKRKGNVPIEKFEKLIQVITGKYAVTLQWISFTNNTGADDLYWSCSIKEDVKHKYIVTITAICMYELLAKVSIYLYAMLKGWINNGLVTREDLEIAKLKESEKYDKD